MPIPENDGLLPLDKGQDPLLSMFIGKCLLFLILRSLARLTFQLRGPLFNVFLSPEYRRQRVCIVVGDLFSATLEFSHVIDYSVPALICGCYAF